VTALFCVEYILGAKLRIELIDSISDPPVEDTFVVINDGVPDKDLF
jgi:hypothetical protein